MLYYVYCTTIKKREGKSIVSQGNAEDGVWFVLCRLMWQSSVHIILSHLRHKPKERFLWALGRLWDRWTILNWTHAHNELSRNNYTLGLHLKSEMSIHISEKTPGRCCYDRCPYTGRAGNTTASPETTSCWWAHHLENKPCVSYSYFSVFIIKMLQRL